MTCLAASALSARADGGAELLVSMAGGKPQAAFDLAGVSKITFGDGAFTVSKADGTQAEEFVYGEVISIRFGGVQTGIGGAAVGGSDVRLRFRDGQIVADGWTDGKTASYAVYDAEGRTVLRGMNWNGTPVDVGGLAGGVYLFSVDNAITIKFAK